MGRGALGTALALLGIALFLLAAVLFALRRESRAREPGVRALLVDASASVRRQRPDWLPWVRAEILAQARRAQEASQQVALVVFASDARVRFPPGSPRDLTDLLTGRSAAPLNPVEGAGDDGASRLESALRIALPWVRPGERSAGNLTLLGDGGFGEIDPSGQLVAVRREGVGLAQIRPPAASLPDLSIVGLELPESPERGAPLGALVRLRFEPGAQGEVQGRLFLRVENGAVRSEHRVRLDLPAHPSTWEVPVDCGTVGFGRTTVQAEVRLDAPDPIPENNRAEATCRSSGERVIGVVADPDQLDEAMGWLAPSGESALPGLQFVPLDLPELVSNLADLDALVTYDLPPVELATQPVRRFVLAGGGWLAVGGWGWLEGWSPAAEGPLAELLPLRPAPSDAPPRDVVLLMDGSGSMAGAPFDAVRSAALDLVAATSPRDQVSLRFFTTRLDEEQRLVSRTRNRGPGEIQALREQAAAELFATRVPGGQTFIVSSLNELAAEREEAENECLALLLTDGQERDVGADPGARAEQVRGRLARARTRLVVVAVGDDPDLAFLRRLTPGDQEPARPAGLEALRELFRREVTGARWREAEPGLSIPLAGAPTAFAREVLGAGVDEDLPGVLRLVKNELRGEAELLWRTTQGEPALAVARPGLGRVALFSSLPARDWAPEWTGRFGLGEPRRFGALLRYLARRPREASLAFPRASVSGNRLRIEGLAPGRPGLLTGRILDVSRGERELGRLELAPPVSGAGLSTRNVREGHLGPDLLALLEQPGRVLFLEQGDVLHEVAPLPLQRRMEFSTPAGLDFEALLTDRQEGSPTAKPPLRGPRGHPGAPFVLVGALACFFLGTLLRVRPSL